MTRRRPGRDEHHTSGADGPYTGDGPGIDDLPGPGGGPGTDDLPGPGDASGIGRRRFLGYVLAAPTLTVAAQLGAEVLAPRAAAAAPAPVPSPPGPAELLDLNDLLTLAALPTSHLLTIRLDPDGTAHLALPRAEVGQGVTTSSAMLVAEELDLPLDKVRVTLADARPELLFNQLTGGSNTTVSTYTPLRVAAAVARGRLLHAASLVLGQAVSTLTTKVGAVLSPTGALLGYGELAAKAAAVSDSAVTVTLKDRSRFRVIGTGRNRVDALAAVTGRKEFAMDLRVPDALPTMICRPPTINGTVRSVANLAEIDCRPETTGRKIPNAYTGPRVTKVVCAVDVGLAVNPRGLEAQMTGGIADGIAITLTSGLHLEDGHFLEGSWDQYFYTRQWNTPPELEVIVMPPTGDEPGGAGELAVAGATAAVACAYGRATGTMPTVFPLNHAAPLAFTPLPTVPPVPASPVDGRARAL
ncbi:molybdopterin cofactor-binding domain-containing protein [Streptomyces cinereoruber]|uniref:molybdopterin cofactor-binding domain-containing protein n=1 Tax=Streptomyces cinereoruber TaxID=67260 RepID=UPI003EB6CD07